MVNRTNRGILSGGAAAAAVAVLCVSANANARTYRVPNHAVDGSSFDRICSLREAVHAANSRRAVDACPAGDVNNEIVITGDPAAPLELTVFEQIEITSNIVLRADPGPGFYQTIIGNDTGFVVHGGGVLTLDSLRFAGFNGTPFYVERNWISGRGWVRGVLDATMVEISDNTGPNAIYQSMGIWNSGGEVRLHLVKIHDNEGAIKGGGVLNNAGSLTVSHSAIYNNTVSQYGGAIHNVGTGAVAWVYNSTLSGNSARIAGGGVYNGPNSTIDITWSTITGNESEEMGAGIYVPSGGTVRVGTSIVSGNLLFGSEVDCSGTLTSTGHNLLLNCPGTASAVGDIRNVRANLSALTFPVGDPSWWRAPWHTPNVGSRAINAIPSGSAGCQPRMIDQIYQSRLIGGACDIGAIERP